MADGGDDFTIGEVVRSLREFKETTKDEFANLNARFDRLDYVSPAVYAADRIAETERHKNVTDRIKVTEDQLKATRDSLQWFVRLVVGSILAGIVTAIVYLSHIR